MTRAPLIGVGQSGAKPALAASARDFDFCDMRLVVVEVEGTVQIAFLADGWQRQPVKVLSNCFCDSGTPAQLRALADYLDGLPLQERVVV